MSIDQTTNSNSIERKYLKTLLLNELSKEEQRLSHPSETVLTINNKHYTTGMVRSAIIGYFKKNVEVRPKIECDTLVVKEYIHKLLQNKDGKDMIDIGGETIHKESMQEIVEE